MQAVDFNKDKIVPILTLDDADRAVPAVRAITDGGIHVMEITFRTEAAAECIRRVSRECPDITIGAGTIITVDQCKEAIESGATFIVTPGSNREVLAYCRDNDIQILSGVATPTEIMMVMEYGFDVVKLFPANVFGGKQAMKAFSGPFPNIRFVPTGGVNGDNLAEYLALPYVAGVGGSWLCSRADISAGNYDKITELCAKAVETAKQA